MHCGVRACPHKSASLSQQDFLRISTTSNSKLDRKQTSWTRVKDGFKENQHQIWQQSVSEEEKWKWKQNWKSSSHQQQRLGISLDISSHIGWKTESRDQQKVWWDEKTEWQVDLPKWNNPGDAWNSNETVPRFKEWTWWSNNDFSHRQYQEHLWPSSNPGDLQPTLQVQHQHQPQRKD